MLMYFVDRQFSEPSYQRLYLESVKITTTAERKKPILVTRSSSLVDVQNNKSQSIDEFFKSRYEARRRFFQDLEHQQAAMESSTEVIRMNNDEGICEQNSAVESNGEIRLYRAEVYDAHLSNTNLDDPNDKKCSNDVTVYPIKWKNMAQTDSVEVVNVKEQVPYDIATSCANDDSQVNEKEEHKEIEYRDSLIEEAVPVMKQSRGTSANNEETNVSSTPDTNKGQQQMTMTAEKVTLTQPFQEDKHSEEKLQPVNALPSNNYFDKHPVGRKCHKDADVMADKGTSNEETNCNAALKNRSIQSWIKNSMCESNYSHSEETSTSESHHKYPVKITKSVDENIVSSKIDLKALSNIKLDTLANVDTPESYYDDLMKMVENMDANIATSRRTELDALPNTDTCNKYNLDSTNMSIIYSLTPSMVVDEEENSNEDDTSQDLAERSSDWHSNATKSDGNDTLGDYIWMESTSMDAKPLDCPCDREASDSSSCELEKHSASSGSDILELPSHTVLELSDINGEVFQNGINESTNEIIADLNSSDEIMNYDSLQIAQCIVAEITECVFVLSYFDSYIYNLGLVREAVRYLLDNYHHECSLLTNNCLSDPAYVSSDALTTSITAANDDDICQFKRFLENSLSDLHRNDRIETRQKEDSSSAVIEFCTVAKKLPFVVANDRTLELNFHVVKVPMDEGANKWLNTPVIDEVEDSTHHVDQDLLKTSRSLSKRNYKENVALMELDIDACDQCPYCREEDDLMTQRSRLTPINEEPNEAAHEYVDDCPMSVLLEDSNDSSYQLGTHLVDENTGNSARKIVSLDDTYTISDYSDNDERSDVREHCDDVWNSSVDCMSCSYDTKEFLRLEKTIVESSQLNA